MTCQQYLRCFLIPCLSLLGSGAYVCAADAVQLTLPEAVDLALHQNRALKIAKFKVAENEQKKAGARSSYFPEIRNQSSILHTTSVQNSDIPAGAFGVIPNIGLVPNRDILIDHGNQTFVTSGTTLVQPLTQLIRIRQANRIAASEVATSRDELKKAENEVALGVHELYYGILIARLQKQAAEQESAYSATRLRESEEDVRNGSALKIPAIEGRAGLLQSEQSVLAFELQTARVDFQMEVGDVNERVEVQATTVELQTENSTVGTTIDSKKIEELPLNGRNFVQLAQLIPGALPGTPGSITVRRGRGSIGQSDSAFGSTGFSANEVRDTANRYYIDGIESMDGDAFTYAFSPSVDSLAEVKVETSTYAADSGAAPGGQISLITKVARIPITAHSGNSTETMH